jgi:hypothetical protein
MLKGVASREPSRRDLEDIGPDGARSEAAIDRMSRSFSGGLSRRLARAASSTTARWTVRPWSDSLPDGDGRARARDAVGGDRLRVASRITSRNRARS